MNSVVLQLANGNSFFAGLVMVVAALFLRLRVEGRISGLVLRTGFITGIVLVIVSATPVAIWLYCLLLIVCVAAALVVFNHKHPFPKRMLASISGFFCSLVICLVELPYHLSPAIQVSPRQTIYVVGDSISAGISAKDRAWPEVLASLSHLKVINLAKPGATVETAMNQTAGMVESNSVVLVEIGGNDLLGRADSRMFHIQLDQLLGRLAAGGNQIVMFELPLLPFDNDFGKAQRSLAGKYHAILIPKHFLTDVFGRRGGTVDGLHLSQQGHDALANSIFRLLKSD